jgi:hypothetical protein
MSIAYFALLIPILAILLGAWKEYYRFQAEQRRLGVSNRQLEGEVDELLKDREALRRRVENLEAIVTSRLWDAAREGAPPVERARLDLGLDGIDEAHDATRKVERLADRLGV